MPRVKFTCVASFSSEIKEHPATNLLADEVTGKRWLCKKGEPVCSVVLQLSHSAKISSITIGSYNAATVEVSVGRSENNNSFETLVPGCVVASAREWRGGAGAGIDRVRSFLRDQLAAAVRDHCWDRVRIQCTPPKHSNLPYGLSFVHVFEETRPMAPPAPVPAPVRSKVRDVADLVARATLLLPATPPRAPIIPPIPEHSWLTLDNGSSDDDVYKPGDLFATYLQERADSAGGASATTDAQIRHASLQARRNIPETSSQLIKTPIANPNTSANRTTTKSQAEDDQNKRNRNNVMYEVDDAKPHAKIDRVVERHKEEKKKQDSKPEKVNLLDDGKIREREKSKHRSDGDRHDKGSGQEDRRKSADTPKKCETVVSHSSNSRKRERDGSNERSKDRDSGPSKREKRSEPHTSEKDKSDKEKDRSKKESTENARSYKDRSEKDRSYKDRPDRDRSCKDRSEKDRSNKDRPDIDRSNKDRPEKDRSNKDRSEKDRSNKDRPEIDRSNKDRPEKDRSNKDRSEKDKSNKDRPEIDGSNKDLPEIDRSNKDRSEKDRSNKDRPEIERSNKDRPEKDRSNKDRSEKDRTNKVRPEIDRSNKDLPEIDRSNKDRSEKDRSNKDRPEIDRSNKDRPEKDRSNKDRSEKDSSNKDRPEIDRSNKDLPEIDRSNKSRSEKDRSNKDRPEIDRSNKDLPEIDRSNKDRSEKDGSNKDRPEKDRSYKDRPEKVRSYKERSEKDGSQKVGSENKSEKDGDRKNERRRSDERNKDDRKRDNVKCEPELKAGPVSTTPQTLMSNVVFTLSGYENPRRADVRSKALAMGAHYEHQWNAKCTHLICAYTNTPKLKAVRALPNGSSYAIAKADWVEECCRLRRVVPWQWHATEHSRRITRPKDWEKQAEDQAACGEEMDTDDEIERIIKKQQKDQAQGEKQNQPATTKRSDKGSSGPKKRPSGTVKKASTVNHPIAEDIQAAMYDVETDVDISCPDHEEIREEAALPDFLDGYVFLIDRSVADDAQIDVNLLERFITAYGGDVVKPSHVDRSTVVDYTVCSGRRAPAPRAPGSALVAPGWLWRCHRKQRKCSTAKYTLKL